MARNTASVAAPRHGEQKVSPLLRLSFVWSCSPRVARARMDRVFFDAADVVTAMMAAGQHDGLARKMAPFDAAMNAWKVTPELGPATISSAKADGAEDNAEAAYSVNPCRETARALIRASAVERLHAEQREAALKARWDR